jgi:hypothetical protein
VKKSDLRDTIEYLSMALTTAKNRIIAQDEKLIAYYRLACRIKYGDRQIAEDFEKVVSM